MKTCPKCKELIGDNVNECFKCHYNFSYGRIITQEERKKEREKEQKIYEQKMVSEQQKNEQIKLFQQQMEEQIKNNPLYEYETIVINDNSDGTVNTKQIQDTLLEYSKAGWRLHSIFTNEIGKSTVGAFIGFIGSNVNATIDQTIIIFERCIKA